LGRKSTYGWDEPTESTFHQRDKEEAHDYRYFPDPDLVPVEVDDTWLEQIKGRIGELPATRRKRYIDTLGLNEKDAVILAGDRATGDFFEQILAGGVDARRASSLMEALREVSNDRNVPLPKLGIGPQRVAEIGQLVVSGKIPANKESARKLLESLMTKDRPAEQAATDLGLLQSTDTGAIDVAIEQILVQDPKPLQDYRAGKQSAFGALVGMVMKNGKGLNAKMVQERLREKLG
jgi:aspartyl-tRNA(Asn)/glutamyl-tRNA(Gln) amidotransferase subunit B